MKKLFLTFISLCLMVSAWAVSPTNITVTSIAGGLSSAIKTAGGSLGTVTTLTVTGTIDARDFKMMRDSMAVLANIDLNEAGIAAYTGTGGTNGTYTITYPANKIPASAFAGNTSLALVIISSTVTSIEYNAFSGCTGLTSATIPISVTSVGSSSFSDCTGLVSLNILSSVASFARSAFFGCTNLASIYAHSAIPNNLNPAYSVFSNVNKTTCFLHVPVGSKVAYQDSLGWKDFTNIVEDLPTTTFNAKASNLRIKTTKNRAVISDLPKGVSVTVYNTQGLIIYNQNATEETISVNLPARGIYIVKVGSQSLKVIN